MNTERLVGLTVDGQIFDFACNLVDRLFCFGTHNIGKEYAMTRSGLFALVGLLMLTSSLSAAPILEVEPSDAVGASQGFALTNSTASITGQVSGSAAAGDVDFFSFTGVAGQQMSFDIDGTPTGSVEFDPFIGVVTLPTTGAYTIVVFDLLGITDDINNSVPLTGLITLTRPDGADGGVRFAPVALTLASEPGFSDTEYTLNVTSMPEPASLILILTGLAAGRGVLRRKTRATGEAGSSLAGM